MAKSRTTSSTLILTLVLVLGSAPMPSAFAEQPKMKEALVHLQAARAALAEATPDKGGHRQRAMRLIEKAINNVTEGMAFDRDH